MSIRVHNSERFEELRQSALDNTLRSRSADCPSSYISNKATATALSKETQMKRTAMKRELCMKEREAAEKKLAGTIAEILLRQKNKKESRYLELQREVEDGKTLLNELHETVELQRLSKTRQLSRMHEEWTAEVYHKLNDPILNKVQTMNSKQRSTEKAEAYQKFLDITNKKGGLFRDIIIESEYDPLNDTSYVTHRAKVDDPMQRMTRRRKEEDAIARDCDNLSNEYPKSQPHLKEQYVGRSDNLDVKLWSPGEFESTPYGYFHKMMNSTASSECFRTYASHVKLDHYNIEKGYEVLRQELPKGKRTNFEGYKVPKTSIQL